MGFVVSSSRSEQQALDLNDKKDVIQNWAEDLTFKRMEAGKHFKKHRNDGPFREMEKVEDYVSAARQNINQALFDRGFVIRTGRVDRIAFFTTHVGGFPNKMTVVGHFANGVGKRISTFYAANGKTSSLIIDNFRREYYGDQRTQDFYTSYIAYFQNGTSTGWQVLEEGFMGRLLKEGAPQAELHREINFLSLD